MEGREAEKVLKCVSVHCGRAGEEGGWPEWSLQKKSDHALNPLFQSSVWGDWMTLCLVMWVDSAIAGLRRWPHLSLGERLREASQGVGIQA